MPSMSHMDADGAHLQALAQDLLRDPLGKAKYIITLLKAVHGSKPAEASVAAIRGLKVFFSDKQENGQFIEAGVHENTSAASKFRVWLAKNQTSFHVRLRRILKDEAADKMQVAAVAALMEAVRGWKDSGTFNAQLFDEAFESLCCQNTSAEALSFFISTYLKCPDARYYTLKSAIKLLQQQAASGADSGALQQSGGHLAGADCSISTMTDVLMHVNPHMEGCADSQPWCGGNAAEAQKGALSSRERRKRKRKEEGGESADKPAGKPTKWANPILQKRAWSNAWLALLAVPLPAGTLRKVLVRMHTMIIPHMANPLLLTDFLTKALDAGGLMGMLALHGIFTLVTKHGLEYPHFYQRLYRLLIPASLMAKHRERFFQLADAFLSSTLVPAYTVAAFAKRFARLALTASPAGAMIAIAFVHNLLRRHPACTVLLHQPVPSAPGYTDADATARQASSPADGQAAGQVSLPDENGQPKDQGGPERPETTRGTALEQSAAGVSEANCTTRHKARADDEHSSEQDVPGMDPYNPAMDDPARSRAIESSLWEMESLRNHYCPQVAAFATVLDKDLADRKKTAEVDIGPLLTLSYSSLSATELGRRLKHVPVAFYAENPPEFFDLMLT